MIFPATELRGLKMKKENKIPDQWQTPQWLFDELNSEFSFDIDLCATQENTKCHIWYKDYLNDVQIEKTYLTPRVATMREYQEIGNANYVCFMNPPYYNPRPFIEKAWEDSKHCKIICLVKCDPSTKWWATFWDYETKCWGKYCDGKGITAYYEGDDYCPVCKGSGTYSGPKPGCEVRYFPKRIQFDPPQQLIESGEVFLVNTKNGRKKWVQKCCENSSDYLNRRGYTLSDGFCRDGRVVIYLPDGEGTRSSVNCPKCKGKGYKELSGPTFPSALIIMDRRGL